MTWKSSWLTAMFCNDTARGPLARAGGKGPSLEISLSASMVREVARLGAGTEQFVPAFVARRLKMKFGTPKD